MKNYRKLYSNKSTNVRFDGLSQQLKRFSMIAAGLFFPQKTKSYLEQVFFKPVRKTVSREKQQWLDRGESFQITVHNKKIQCWRWGTGPSILAVHGWSGIGVDLFPFFPLLLRQGYSVITFDAPAHGSSEGRQTNYFEMTDTVRELVRKIGTDSLAGIIAHSLGGAAVINCLSKEKISPKTVLIAPALKLRELLFNTFNKNGVPKRLYTSIMAEIENKYGYSLKQDNPYILLEHLDVDVLIAHDQKDRMVPFADAQTIASKHRNIFLHQTKGLGHNHILKDKNTSQTLIDYLTQSFTKSNNQKLTSVAT